MTAAKAIALAMLGIDRAKAQEIKQPITKQPQATAPAEEDVRSDPKPAMRSPPLLAATPVGRAAENVVTQAEDAFGTSIGRETIGLYSGGNVRGFSAVAAGNTRIDTLYFDQQYGPNVRIRRSTNIRVGLSTLGFPFPAPTGIVDYQLKKPGREALLSTYASLDSWRGASLEVDAVVPISPALSAGGGVAIYKNEFANATDSLQHVEGANLLWTPGRGFALSLSGSDRKSATGRSAHSTSRPVPTYRRALRAVASSAQTGPSMKASHSPMAGSAAPD